MVLISALSAFRRRDRASNIIMTAVRMMITPPRTPPTITPSVVEPGEVLCGEEDCNDGAEVGLVTTK
jgi:hypothetical protein